ncbi:MAG: Sip1-related alpha-galactosidase [Planctomycetota bacterium]|jgi:hypothetical protein
MSARQRTTILALSLFVIFLSPSANAEEKVICIAELPAQGVRVLEGYAGKPSGKFGILESFEVVLPSFERGCYFSADKELWPNAANRHLPWILHGNLTGLFKEGYVQNSTVGKPNRQSLFVLFKLTTGEYVALVPIAGTKTMSWLKIDEAGRLTLNLGTLGTAPVACDAPLFAWARSKDVYAACRLAWGQALSSSPVRGRTMWRTYKEYPELFRYLGWCSWEQYRSEINEKVLLDAVDGIESSGLPIRWILVDDGHQTIKDRQLISFVPDKEKFPNGWTSLLDRRKEDKIKWMGLWHCFHGYWKNIHPDNEFAGLNEHLIEIHEDGNSSLVSKNDPQSAKVFYNAMIGSVKDYGFDFVKIDTQASNLSKYTGLSNAVQAHAWNAEALEKACRRDMSGLINCMAHNSSCVFNTRYSNVTRCSIDYKIGNAAKGKSHLQQSFNNTLWLGQTVWPDHDMFHSSDQYCGRMMAVSKSLSGAPVYLSDAPNDFVADYIKPLAYEDGELLRPLAPAVPLPDSVFLDALNEAKAYRVIAPLANESAAVAVYSLAEPSPKDSIDAGVSARDYSHAPAMIQPYPGKWDEPEEGLVVYNWYSGTGGKLVDSYRVRLKGFSDCLLLLCPIRRGWAVVGRADKYLSPSAIKTVVYSDNKLKVTLYESGPLVIWCKTGTPKGKKLKFTALGNGLWKADMPVGRRDYAVTVSR